MSRHLIEFGLFIILLNSIVLIKASGALECNHLTPFVWNKLPLSVDLTKLNLFPDRDDYFSKNGFKDSIFNLTCKQDNKFELPNLVIENEIITYYLPDHFKFENHNSYSHDTIVHRVFEADEEAYRRNMMRNLYINLNDEEKAILEDLGYDTLNLNKLFIGAFKLNKNYQRMRKERFANGRISVESRINMTGYFIRLNDSAISLSNAFLNEINNLPISYEDSKYKYESLISTFGTHYFSSYIVGGFAKASFKIITEDAPVQLDQVKKDEFENNRPFNFDLTGLEFNVDENFGSNETYFIADDKLHKRTINFYGGRIENKNHTVEKWKRSVKMDPWLVGGRLEPLSRLIKNKQQKKNFLRAMISYLDKAEIINLKETCNALEEYSELNKWLNKYKEKVDELNERQFVNHTNLVDLSVQFNDDINIEIRKHLLKINPISNIFNSQLGGENEDHGESNEGNFGYSNFSINVWLLISILFLNFVYFNVY